MGFVIREDMSKFDATMSSGSVVVQSTLPKNQFSLAIDQLTGREPKDLALNYAASKGMSGPALNGMGGHPFPLDKDGKSILNTVMVSDGATMQMAEPACYCVEIKVARSL